MGFSSCGTWAQLLRGMWDLPGPGHEPVSPALAGGFLTTAPQGKPLQRLLTVFFFFLTFTSFPGERVLGSPHTIMLEIELPSRLFFKNIVIILE